MDDPEKIASRYLELLNEGDEARRSALLESWLPDADYRDPPLRVEGRERIGAMIGALRETFPDHRFALGGTPDRNGDVVRVPCQLRLETAGPVALGTDLVRLGRDGRIEGVSAEREQADEGPSTGGSGEIRSQREPRPVA